MLTEQNSAISAQTPLTEAEYSQTCAAMAGMYLQRSLWDTFKVFFNVETNQVSVTCPVDDGSLSPLAIHDAMDRIVYVYIAALETGTASPRIDAAVLERGLDFTSTVERSALGNRWVVRYDFHLPEAYTV
jgi:hypothetical protein